MLIKVIELSKLIYEYIDSNNMLIPTAKQADM